MTTLKIKTTRFFDGEQLHAEIVLNRLTESQS
jgi:hypothetical protein